MGTGALYKYINIETIVTGDYKYPFKCVRRIVTVPEQLETTHLTDSWAMFATIFVSPNESTGTYKNELHLWADGSVPSDTFIQINLKDGINSTIASGEYEGFEIINPYMLPDSNVYIDQWVGGLVNYLMGESQPDDLPCIINAYGNYIYPKTTRWDNGKVIFKPKPVNIFLSSPIQEEITITSYCMVGSSSLSFSHALTAPVHKRFDEIGNAVNVFATPQLYYHEPLTGLMYIEGEFIKDGVCSPNLIIESSWKENPIRKQVLINAGTSAAKEIFYELPQITLKNDGSPNNNIELSSYIINSGYERTTIYPSILNSVAQAYAHTHSCIVNSLGDGITTETIFINTIFTSTDHIHEIQGFTAKVPSILAPHNFEENLNHIHEVACTAITQIKATDNANINTRISAYVPYDPTLSQTVQFPSDYPSITGVNRILKLGISSFINETITVPTLLSKGNKSEMLSNRRDFEESVIDVSNTYPTSPILTLKLFSSSGYGEGKVYGDSSATLTITARTFASGNSWTGWRSATTETF